MEKDNVNQCKSEGTALQQHPGCPQLLCHELSMDMDFRGENNLDTRLGTQKCEGKRRKIKIFDHHFSARN